MRWAISVAQFLIANQHSFDYQPDHACNRVCSQETLMTLGRILLVSLCSAASLTIVSGAQAADLPVKAKAVEYVRVCSLYGAGFFYIPGTDTCIKLGGYVRVDTTFNGSIYDQPAWSGDLGQGNRYRDVIQMRSRLAITVDTRTATEYGVVRTFGQFDTQFNDFGTTNPNALAANISALNGLSGGILNGPGGGYVAVEMAFI